MSCAVCHQGLLWMTSWENSIGCMYTLMQEFYCIVQGKSEKVQTFVLHLERALKGN